MLFIAALVLFLMVLWQAINFFTVVMGLLVVIGFIGLMGWLLLFILPARFNVPPHSP